MPEEYDGKLKAIFESVNDAIFLLDLEGHFIDINRTAHERLGYSREEMLSMHISELDPPEFADRVPERLELLMREGKAVFESAHVKKDGSVMPVEVNSRFIELHGRKLFLSVIRDITARKEAEAALSRSELELSAIYDHTPSALLLLDEDRRVRKMNRMALKFSVNPLEKNIGLRGGEALRCIHAEDDPRGCGFGEACESCVVRTTVTETIKSGKAFERIEASIPHENGGKAVTLWFMLSTTPIKLPEENLVLVCLDDIGRLKEAENTLREYAGRLEHSNYLKDLFSDIISHDIINPANIVLIMSKRLRELDDMPYTSELSMIVRNAEKMIGLLTDASTFARVENVDELEMSENDLVVILSSTIERLQPLAAEAGVNIAFNPRKEAPLSANPVIEYVFANILSNAIKYSPADTEVRVAIEEANGAWKVTAADQGDGISDEFKEIVFERFQRGGKEGVKGSGLGLAIAKRVVDLHGGRIWVENNQGGGSIFNVQLPRNPAGQGS